MSDREEARKKMRDDAWWQAVRHVPDRTDIQQLLERYFVGPITTEVVDTVEAEFTRVRGSSTERSSHQRSYEGIITWSGTAWWEQTIDRRWMTPTDLVSLIANMYSINDDAFPQPKWYCPDRYVGTWEQLEPVHTPSEPILWHLSADGSFRSNSPDVPPGLPVWCITHTPDRSWENLTLNAPATGGCWGLVDMKVTERELSGKHITFNEADERQFRWRRHQQ